MNTLYGLIVCGGKSSRFGTDKSLLNYHGIPQREYLFNLLSEFCDEVFFSVNESQAKDFDSTYNLIVDEAEYKDIGPMSALLSAWKKFPEVSLFVTGCDYPFINESALRTILSNRKKNATCLMHNESKIYEPLLTIYESSLYKIVQDNFYNGNFSLSRILSAENVSATLPASDLILTNVNTRREFIKARKIIAASAKTS